MKPIELRVGNFIEYQNMYYTVVNIKPPYVDLQMLSDNDIYSDFKDIPMEIVKPIPITKEILLKNGFKKDIDANNLYRFAKGECLFEVRLWDSGTLIKLENYEVDNVKKVHLPKTNYIHQLQNAYQLVTGNELEIKL